MSDHGRMEGIDDLLPVGTEGLVARDGTEVEAHVNELGTERARAICSNARAATGSVSAGA